MPGFGDPRILRRVMNLSHMLRANARRLGEDIALVHGEIVLTWAELDRRVDAMAAALGRAGIAKGDRILVQSRNCIAMFETMFVCWRLGAIWVPTNFRQTPAEVGYIARLSGASAMFCQAEFADHAAAAREAAPGISLTVVIGEAQFGASYEAVIAQNMGQGVTTMDVEHDDPCWLFCTSGTSGRPKAAVLTHGQMAFVVTNHLNDLMPGMAPHSDASIVVAPLSHGAGVHQLAQVARGIKTIIPSQTRLDPEEIWHLVERWAVTNMFTVPTIVNRLLEGDFIEKYDIRSLRYMIYAGAPMYREDQRRALLRLGSVMVQYYGLGEVTGAITVLPSYLHSAEDEADYPIGSCGFERTGMQISIQDSAGNEVPPNMKGEICVCGLAVFAGYYDDPDANAAAFRDGWFRTGDLGFQDERGFLHITGRASEMFISGGSNVYPLEIEESILSHPAIAEVAVIGMPDPQWGESGLAVLVLNPGAACTTSDILEHLQPRLAQYKWPRRIIFWNDLPKTGYGKIAKKEIRKTLEHEVLGTVDGVGAPPV